MPESTATTITANGRSFTVAEGTPLPDFIRSLDLPPEQVVVEYNGEALSPSESARVALKPGDRLELVRVVAGG